METISVILSTYNEPIDMISMSINSILKQTYSKLELILINDNPLREDLHVYLKSVEQCDDRVVYIRHTKNKGLVSSLNEGISLARGIYIARMDADDVSHKDRLMWQIEFIKKNNCDIVGSCITKIDENNRKVGNLMLPTYHEMIEKYIPYGSCVLHPTWLVKKIVYDKLGGYRDIVGCEDYDFLLRAINCGFILGNIPQIGLDYRIRTTGISQTINTRQNLTMYYLASRFKKHKELNINLLNEYLSSNQYKQDCVAYDRYKNSKQIFLDDNYLFLKRVQALGLMFFSKYLYKNILEVVSRRIRERHVYRN